jgi:hypothetical protein
VRFADFALPDFLISDDFLLTVVTNVPWKPTYELHATTDNGRPLSSVAPLSRVSRKAQAKIGQTPKRTVFFNNNPGGLAATTATKSNTSAGAGAKCICLFGQARTPPATNAFGSTGFGAALQQQQPAVPPVWGNASRRALRNLDWGLWICLSKYLSFPLLLLLLSHQAPAQPAAGAFGKGSTPDDRERERGADGGSAGLFRGVFGSTNTVIPSSEDAEDLGASSFEESVHLDNLPSPLQSLARLRLLSPIRVDYC